MKPITRYDAYEISPCVLLTMSDGTTGYEAVENLKGLTPGQKKRLTFTLYGHIHGEGAQMIGDFAKWEWAVERYRKITGCRVGRQWKNTRQCGLPTEPGSPAWGMVK